MAKLYPLYPAVLGQIGGEGSKGGGRQERGKGNRRGERRGQGRGERERREEGKGEEEGRGER